MDNDRQGVLAALIYSDVFSTPLTLSEVRYYAQVPKKITKETCRKILASLSPIVNEKDGYYFLSGRTALSSARKKGRRYAAVKRRLAQRVVKWLSRIPTVQFIGISGSVAGGMAQEDDDIDLFIITKENTLYSTRFCILVLLQLLGVRRKRTVRSEKDTFCVNMLIDERNMTFPRSRQDIYTAREITQLLPVFSRNNTYRRFLKENAWVYSLLPNAVARHCRMEETTTGLLEKMFLFILSCSLPERIAKSGQVRKMKRHRTTETVTDRMLAFHPNDYRKKTIKRVRLVQERLKYQEMKGLHNRDKAFLDKEFFFFYTA